MCNRFTAMDFNENIFEFCTENLYRRDGWFHFVESILLTQQFLKYFYKPRDYGAFIYDW